MIYKSRINTHTHTQWMNERLVLKYLVTNYVTMMSHSPLCFLFLHLSKTWKNNPLWRLTNATLVLPWRLQLLSRWRPSVVPGPCFLLVPLSLSRQPVSFPLPRLGWLGWCFWCISLSPVRPTPVSQYTGLHHMRKVNQELFSLCKCKDVLTK